MPVVATTGAVLEQGGNARCFDDRCIWFLRSENCGGSAVAVLVDVCLRSSSLVVDVPVIKQRRLRSGSTTDSVHRQTLWTFQLCNRFAYGGYGGDV